MRRLLEGKKIRLIYLLALLQLLAGPLMIFQVSLFGKLAVREIPRHGMAAGFQKAWHSHEFDAAISRTGKIAAKENKNAPAPTSDPKTDLMKPKAPALPWKPGATVRKDIFVLVPCSDWSRRWTPIWPQAPPGPPPRVG